jgi:type 1 glutamine amidotransferase
MRIRCLFAALLLCGSLGAQEKKKLLFIGEAQGFQHDSVSHAAGTLWKLGRETGLWDTYIRTDSQLITKKPLENNAHNLNFFDAVFFFTSGSLAMDAGQKADLLSFVRDDGKGFLGAHSATDTFYDWPEYGDMIGAYFDDHPWAQEVGINVEDRDFPATAHFGPQFTISEEVYQFRAPYSRDNLHVLMSLDTSTVDLSNPRVRRTDGDFALTWVRQYGRGRVFYSALGHAEQVWDRPDIQQMWVEGVKWAMGLTP